MVLWLGTKSRPTSVADRSGARLSERARLKLAEKSSSRTRRDRSAEPSSNALFDTQNLTVERKTRTEISVGKRVLKVYFIELNSTVENSVLQDYTPTIKRYSEDGVWLKVVCNTHFSQTALLEGNLWYRRSPRSPRPEVRDFIDQKNGREATGPSDSTIDAFLQSSPCNQSRSSASISSPYDVEKRNCSLGTFLGKLVLALGLALCLYGILQSLSA